MFVQKSEEFINEKVFMSEFRFVLIHCISDVFVLPKMNGNILRKEISWK